MKKFNLPTFLILLFALILPQYVVAKDAEVDANVITSDANGHYLTIDYTKYSNFETKEINVENWKTTKITNAYNLDNGNLDISFYYPCNKVDFKISTTWLFAWGDANIAIDETYNNNGSWDDSKEVDSKTKIEGHNKEFSITGISHSEKIAKKIAFKKTGGNSSGKYVHDIKLHIAPHILFSSPTTFDFAKTKKDECNSYHTIDFYSFLSEGELIIEQPTNFIITSINGQTPILTNGGYHIANNNTLKYIDETSELKKYSIVVGFKPTTTGNITETIKIKDNKNEKTITLNGIGFDKQPQIISWNQSLASLEVGTTTLLDATTSSGMAITYTSSNPSVVSIDGNMLTAHKNGTATITAHAEGNDLYAPATIEKYAKVGNGNIDNCQGNIILKTHNGATGTNFSYTFTDLPPIKGKIVKYNYTIAKKPGVFSSNTSYSVSISNNIDNNKTTFSESNSDRKNTKTGSCSYTFEKEDITELTLTMSSNQGSSAISNISVELPTTLYTDQTGTIEFPQTPANESTAKQLKISFAQLKDNIDISIIGDDANHFAINQSYIATGCGKWGINNISIYFSPQFYKEDVYSATLVIKSEGQSNIEILLKGTSLYRETTFNKNGYWNDPANWSGGVPTGIGKNAIIDANVIIPNNYAAVINNITITNNGFITIEPQGALKANNIVGANINNLMLQANENGSAILVFNNPSANKVNASIQLYSLASSDGLRNEQAGNFRNPKWQYLGVVTEQVPFSTLNPNGTSNWIFRWDETQNATSCWAEQLSNSSTLSAWIGYCLAQESATTYNYTGALINEDHTYALTYTPDNASADLGNNLITNSYTAPIDLTTINTSNFTNAEANIYIYNTGSYLDWKEQTNLEGFNPGQVIVIPTNTISALGNEYPRTIASSQAFFIKATAENASFSINYKNNVYDIVRKENQMRAREKNISFNVLKIQVACSTSNDRLYLLEHENTSADFDNGYDAQKIFDNPNGPQIYASTSFGCSSINTDESFDGQAIGFVANNENELYTLSFNIENLHSYEQLWLYDTETDLYVDILNKETYQFYGSTIPNNNRFYITTINPNAPEIEDTQTNIETTTWDDILTENQPIYIYSITGQLIGTYNQIATPPMGIYIVKCGNKTMKIRIIQ